MAGRRLERERRRQAQAQGVGAVGFLVACALPVWLWHGVVSDIASQFELSPHYLIAGWTPWVLLVLGLACLATGGIVEWRNRERRFYAPGGGPWFGWGVSLYLLGFGLATQVAQIAEGLSAG